MLLTRLKRHFQSDNPQYNDNVENNVGPYIGPRPYEKGETLYGRNQETRALLRLFKPERIVLLHSPSGAGKTSLIQALFIPMLEDEGFSVLPVMRVTHPKLFSEEFTPANRYILSTLIHLESAQPEEYQLSLTELNGLSMSDYLEKRPASSKNSVLIFDQFEEILTQDPTDSAIKREFFNQVGEVLSNRHRWALFAMREEYIGGLEPYLDVIPTHLQTTFRLNFLNRAEALRAIQLPAKQYGVNFTNEAAEGLVDDLRTVVRELHSDSKAEKALGDTIEPVQLQVACFELWKRPRINANEIGVKDLQRFDVDRALAKYYADSVREVAKAAKVDERSIRRWMEEHLITKQGIRNQVLQDDARKDHIDTVISKLVDAHLVRREKSRGGSWYELAHDRLVDPVRDDNKQWRDKNLKSFQRKAEDWYSQGRPAFFLLHGQELAEAEKLGKKLKLLGFEEEFLKKSRSEQTTQAELALAKQQRTQIFRLSLLAFILLATTSLTIWKWRDAEKQREIALQQTQLANKEKSRADYLKLIALARLEEEPLNLLLLTETIRSAAKEGEIAIVEDARLALRHSLLKSKTRPLEQSMDILTFTGDNQLSIIDNKNFNEVSLNVESTEITSSSFFVDMEDLDVHEALAFAFDPNDYRKWFAIGNEAGKLALVDRRNRAKPVFLDGHKGPVSSLAFSSDSRWLVSGGEDHIIKLWDTFNLIAKPQEISNHKGTISALLLSPNNRWLVSIGDDAIIRLSDLNKSTNESVLLENLEENLSEIPMAFSADSHWLAVGIESSVKLWKMENSIANPIVLSEFDGRTVQALSFSPNNQLLATSNYFFSSDEKFSTSKIKLWNMNNPDNDPIESFIFEGETTNLIFHPGGDWLVIADSSVIQQWPLTGDSDNPNNLIISACNIAGRNLDESEWERHIGKQIPYQKTCPLEFDQERIDKESMISDYDKELIMKGYNLALNGKIKEAVEEYSEAQKSDPTLEIDAIDWHFLCWQGSIGGYANEVLSACEKAVELEDYNGEYRNSRGLARALTENFAGAIEDFDFYVKWANDREIEAETIKERERWIDALKEKDNPFNSDVLEELRSR